MYKLQMIMGVVGRASEELRVHQVIRPAGGTKHSLDCQYELLAGNSGRAERSGTEDNYICRTQVIAARSERGSSEGLDTGNTFN